jgi:hypothetical protein
MRNFNILEHVVRSQPSSLVPVPVPLFVMITSPLIPASKVPYMSDMPQMAYSIDKALWTVSSYPSSKIYATESWPVTVWCVCAQKCFTHSVRHWGLRPFWMWGALSPLHIVISVKSFVEFLKIRPPLLTGSGANPLSTRWYRVLFSKGSCRWSMTVNAHLRLEPRIRGTVVHITSSWRAG